MREEPRQDEPQIFELGNWKGSAYSLTTLEGGVAGGEEVRSSVLGVVSLG